MLRVAVLLAVAVVSSGQATRQELAAGLLERLVGDEVSPEVGMACRRQRFPLLLKQQALDMLEEVWVKGEDRVNVSVPEAVQNWGTDGRQPQAYKFRNWLMNLYFMVTYKAVKFCSLSHGIPLELSQDDLFFGHTFAFTREDGTKDYGIVFNAKARPEDLVGAGSGYNTSVEGYQYRNIVWVASQERAYIINTAGEDMAQLLTAEYLSPPPTDNALLDELWELSIRANTLQHAYFGEWLGAINYFDRRAVQAITETDRRCKKAFYFL